MMSRNNALNAGGSVHNLTAVMSKKLPHSMEMKYIYILGYGLDLFIFAFPYMSTWINVLCCRLGNTSTCKNELC